MIRMYIECQYCGNEYSKKHIVEHLRIHTFEKPFICDSCTESFASKANLEKHRNKYHLEIFYSCFRCNRTFISRTLLTKHDKNRNNKLSFQCDKCCSSFARKGNLENHLRLVHSEDSNPNLLVEENDRLNKMDSKSTTSENPGSSIKGQLQQVEVKASGSTSVATAATQGRARSICKDKIGKIEIKDTKVDRKSKRKANVDIKENPPKRPTFKATGQNLAIGDVYQYEVHTHTSFDSENVTSAISNPLDLRLDQDGKNLEFTETFALSSWRLNKTVENLEAYCTTSFGSSGQTIFKNLICFFKGDKFSLTVEDVMIMLQSDLVNQVGLFISCLIVIESAIALPLGSILKLYEQRLELEEQTLGKLVTDLTLYLIQRKLNNACITDELLDDLPDEFLGQLAVNIQDLNSNGQDTLRPGEIEMLFSILIDLLNMMHQDLLPNGLKVFVSEIKPMELSRLWSIVATKYVNQLPCKHRISPFQMILADDIRMNSRTQHYINAEFKPDKFRPVYLHREVVDRFCHSTNLTNTPIFLKATIEDVDVFLQLLYYNHDEKELKGKITLGVYRLAKGIGVDNVWFFFFRNKLYSKFIQERNKADFLQMMILEKRLDVLDSLAEHFMQWIPEKERSSCLNGISPDNVILFLDRACLNLEEIEVYRILIQWSFDKANKKCTNELEAPFDSDVFKHFKLVREVLRLLDLRPYFPRLMKQKYITLKDIKDATYYSSALLHSAKPSDTWFAVVNRSNKECPKEGVI